jgi:hypothetical protein
VWLAAAVGLVGCGSSGSSRSVPATGETSAALPPPTFGRTVDLRPVRGTVLVQVSGTRGQAFVRLSAARQVPLGTKVDTTAGAVRLTAATATPGQAQTGEFYGGIFTIFQRRADRGITDLRINDNRSRATACGPGGGTSRRRLSARILGLLRGNATGRFRTTGEFGAATVHGTQWGVRNRCDGTLTVVQRGVVVVRDFRLNKDITVRAGQTYLAKAA